MAWTGHTLIPYGTNGIIFDMDGVLIDSHPAHLSAWKAFLASLGKTISDSELNFILDGRRREDILRHFLGNLTPQQLAEYGSRKDELLRRRGSEIQPIPGALDFLNELTNAGIAIALATSAGRLRAHGTLNQLGLIEYFDVIVTADEVHACKPDPEIYRTAADRLRIEPHQIVAVEDAVSGVKAARAAGMQCLGVADPERAPRLLEAGAYEVLPDLRGLSLTRDPAGE